MFGLQFYSRDNFGGRHWRIISINGAVKYGRGAIRAQRNILWRIRFMGMGHNDVLFMDLSLRHVCWRSHWKIVRMSTTKPDFLVFNFCNPRTSVFPRSAKNVQWACAEWLSATLGDVREYYSWEIGNKRFSFLLDFSTAGDFVFKFSITAFTVIDRNTS